VAVDRGDGDGVAVDLCGGYGAVAVVEREGLACCGGLEREAKDLVAGRGVGVFRQTEFEVVVDVCEEGRSILGQSL
jgi:hypothetical protein